MGNIPTELTIRSEINQTNWLFLAARHKALPRQKRSQAIKTITTGKTITLAIVFANISGVYIPIINIEFASNGVNPKKSLRRLSSPQARKINWGRHNQQG